MSLDIDSSLARVNTGLLRSFLDVDLYTSKVISGELELVVHPHISFSWTDKNTGSVYCFCTSFVGPSCKIGSPVILPVSHVGWVYLCLERFHPRLLVDIPFCFMEPNHRGKAQTLLAKTSNTAIIFQWNSENIHKKNPLSINKTSATRENQLGLHSGHTPQ